MNGCSKIWKQRFVFGLVLILFFNLFTFNLLPSACLVAHASEIKKMTAPTTQVKVLSTQFRITEQQKPCDTSIYLKTYNPYTKQYYTIL